MSYKGPLKEKLKEAGAEVGDVVRITKNNKEKEGVLLPNTGSQNTFVLKLGSGYNTGIKDGEKVKVEKVEKKDKNKSSDVSSMEPKPKKKDIEVSVLIAGGTIASRVDYRTGAVKPSASEEELLSFNPELAEVADIEAREVMQTLSENIKPKDWKKIAKEVKEEIDKAKDGVVVAHGTDTMGYTAAALSFMLKDLSVPVVLVGSQRSSDRGSSDAYQNLACAVKAATTDMAEVMVCMHGESSDSFCYLHPGTKVRKMHTSRRDAFRTVNSKPYGKVDWETLEVEKIRDDCKRKDKGRKTELKDNFEEDVSLVKICPGMDAESFKAQLQGTEGVVVEGTGLGHLPLEDKDIKEVLENYLEDGNVVFMSSQCLYGRVNMNVYETGVDLQDMGVIGDFNDILPETAYVKLGWLLGNYDKNKVKNLMLQDLRGELSERTEHDEFEEEV
ncbi:MAG: Glu-tRNA(Gln) amidotransferase subunit GatD [Candidatus Aenigmatarchaeota archaeon]